MTETATKEKPKVTRNVERPRGWLSDAVKEVCDDFISGKISLPEGKTLTPHYVATFVATQEKLDAPPSTGAVSAVFKRWDEYGFALFHKKPFAFKDYSAKGKKVGLHGLIDARKEARSKERAAAKAEASAD